MEKQNDSKNSRTQEVKSKMEDGELVIEKSLTSRDVDPKEGCFFIPWNEMRYRDFLNEDEVAHINEFEGQERVGEERILNSLSVNCVIEPNVTVCLVHLKIWLKEKDPTSGEDRISYVLTKNWNDISSDNNLLEGQMVQLWAVRVGGVLWFALRNLTNLEWPMLQEVKNRGRLPPSTQSANQEFIPFVPEPVPVAASNRPTFIDCLPRPSRPASPAPVQSPQPPPIPTATTIPLPSIVSPPSTQPANQEFVPNVPANQEFVPNVPVAPIPTTTIPQSPPSPGATLDLPPPIPTTLIPDSVIQPSSNLPSPPRAPILLPPCYQFPWIHHPSQQLHPPATGWDIRGYVLKEFMQNRAYRPAVQQSTQNLPLHLPGAAQNREDIVRHSAAQNPEDIVQQAEETPDISHIQTSEDTP